MHVWDTLNDLGYYHPYNLLEFDSFLKEDSLDKWGFHKAYEWLKSQMLEKNIEYTASAEHMIWSWYQWNGTKQPKPDKRFRSVYNYFEDEPYVLLELEINPARVLLSDYDLWHWVLNYWHVGMARESNRFSNQYNYYKEKPLNNNDGHEKIIKSWETVFDLAQSRKIVQLPKKHQQIQATFFELFFTDIVKVHFFANKKNTSTLILPHS
jgi:hypothetical protein